MSKPVLSVHAFDQRLIDGLYMEAIVLADEARSFFEQFSAQARADLDQLARVDFACESLKVTTRVMHVIAWLLTQRAVFAGELSETVRCEHAYQLGNAAPTSLAMKALFSGEMAGLILASEDLYERVARLELQLIHRLNDAAMSPASPVQDLLTHLERSL